MDSDSSIKYPWQQTLLDAFMERDPDQLREKIASAEKIISERIIAPPRDPDEQIALEDGLRALRTLARMKPDKCRSRQAISFFDDFPSSSAKRGLLFERQRGDAVRQMPAYQA